MFSHSPPRLVLLFYMGKLGKEKNLNIFIVPGSKLIFMALPTGLELGRHKNLFSRLLQYF